MKHIIMIEIPENIKFDPKKPFYYRVLEVSGKGIFTDIGITGNCDCASHAFDQAYQRLQEYLSK